MRHRLDAKNSEISCLICEWDTFHHVFELSSFKLNSDIFEKNSALYLSQWPLNIHVHVI